MNFPVPSSKLVVESSSFCNEKSRHQQHVLDHYFNYSIDVLVPNSTELPVLSSGFDCTSYIIHNLPVAELVKKSFADTLLKKGYFSALSHNTWIDSDNVVAVLPTGKLVLSVSKDIYEELGIVGRPSTFDERRKPKKFFIEIDLLSPSFQEGKKNYEHVQWCFKDRLDLIFSFMVTWQPKDSQIDLLHNYFKAFTLQSLPVKNDVSVLGTLQVPEIYGDCLHKHPSLGIVDKDTGLHNAVEFYEWMGAVTCKCQCAGEPDSFLSTYHHPEPSLTVPSSACARWQGFISSRAVVSLLQTLRSFLVTNADVPWIAMSVHGFMDSPVSWKNREHGFHKFGDNLYTYVVFPDDKYILYTAVGTDDLCP
ncbi:ribonuclease P protein subunit p40-like isoform X2 [Anneissia japonica]|uniref:ribonuclease P protein subunit p40-like isoform X2 n=1 Tax=Anneissia japonica TaxID=1529436 RepID=UPI001425A512|nr:ribonuclease P protein subunit p40-like isoform X2 [Anneissia japonica]